jgi:hypothetical protein
MNLFLTPVPFDQVVPFSRDRHMLSRSSRLHFLIKSAPPSKPEFWPVPRSVHIGLTIPLHASGRG